MYIFNVISLLGGLAMFLYGMRLMGDSLKEGSSGTLKLAMEKVTNNPLKAFLLGLAVTAIIQSSTATIVITSGLVAAGIISLDQSLGIIVGANVGTTVTGQIIRLLDINADTGSFSILRFFQPSTLAPIALILGIVFIMFCNFKKSNNIGSIAVGFGILFSGLMNMTASVSSLTESGVLEPLFAGLGNNPFLSYLVGASVAFILQSSSATIGILQAFSMAGDIPFKGIYACIVGIYLGDCVTTAIVCSIGAKSDAKRVGVVNILFNLSETVVVLIVVNALHAFGALNSLWDMPLRSGGIANTNTVFNLGCAILLLPMVGVYASLSRRIIKDEDAISDKYADKITALNPVFFNTPAIALGSAYDVLLAMFDASVTNINRSLDLIFKYDESKIQEIEGEETLIDSMTDKVDNYLVKFSPHVSEDLHIRILDQYHKMVTEFERLGDHATNIAEVATSMNEEGVKLSKSALGELVVVRELLDEITGYARLAFAKRDVEAAKKIEPLEEVMDDMLSVLHDNHIRRLHEGKCTIRAGVLFLDALSNLERVSDICANVGVATITRVNPELSELAHSYVVALHKGEDEEYNRSFDEARAKFFKKLDGAKYNPPAVDVEIKEKASKEKDPKKTKDKNSKKKK